MSYHTRYNVQGRFHKGKFSGHEQSLKGVVV